jgi:8-oxo-dGTP pyrophosphatase MutT (NUDIX family)
MNPFKLISSREVYKNPWMSLREDIVIKDWKEWLFGVTTYWEGTAILALDDENNVYLVEEYKYALGREDINLPGGSTDPGESPLITAKRELHEELGIEARDWTSLWHIHPLTTIVSQTEYLFLARGISFVDKPADTWEETKLLKIPYTQALQMVMNSEITHGASVAAILKAQKYI